MTIQVIQQGRVLFVNGSSLSDVSQASLRVPSPNDNTSTTSDCESKKKEQPDVPGSGMPFNFYTHNLVVFFQLV